MPIDAVNTAMTPLQFARARGRIRTVETNAALTSHSGSTRASAAAREQSAEESARRPHHNLPPATFHWSYTLTRVNGKPAAKRTPQFADTNLWSVAINRLG
jgi:hypothetical protein